MGGKNQSVEQQCFKAPDFLQENGSRSIISLCVVARSKNRDVAELLRSVGVLTLQARSRMTAWSGIEWPGCDCVRCVRARCGV